VVTDIEAFTNGHEPADDQTLLVVAARATGVIR
jgi:hypothetical protein